MPDVLIPYYAIKTLDPVSGATKVDRLPHLHQTRLDVRAIQPGAVGSSAVGAFSTPLFPPGSDEWASAQYPYSQLAYGQRIEFYDGDVFAGDPKYTGVITGLPTALNNYTLTGQASEYLAQRALTDRNYSFSGTTDTLLTNSLKANSLVYGDDTFTSLGGYTNNGTWTLTTDEGLAGTLAGAGGDGLLYTTTSYGNGNYSECVLDAIYHLTCGSTATNNAEAGLIAAVTDANNLVMGRAIITCSNSTLWRLDAEIWSKSGGTYTARKGVPWSLNLTSNVWRGQVRLFGKQNGANYTWTVIIDGYDVGCSWTTASTPSGAVGFRSTTGTSRFATYMCFLNKTSIFTAGSVTAGSLSLNQKFSRVPLLDLWNIAATTEGSQWRKNPKAGLNADTIDFGALGTDLTATVKIEEGVNLVEPSSVGPNAEIPATEIELSPGPGAIGSVTWHNITAMRNYGVLSDTSSAQYVTDFLGQRATAKAIADKRATPGVAKSLTILRDARYASATSPTGMLMRELDSVDVTSPRLGLFHQKVQILGYVINEGQPEMQLIGDQFPLYSQQGQQSQLRRMWQQMNALANATNAPINASPLVVNTVGTGIWDNSGLVSTAVISSLGLPSAGAQNISTANKTTFTDVTSVTVSVTLSRIQNLICLFLANGSITVGAQSGYVRCNSGGAGINSGNLTWSSAGVETRMGWLYLPGVAAGTYTIKLEGSTDANTTTVALTESALQVFQLGG